VKRGKEDGDVINGGGGAREALNAFSSVQPASLNSFFIRRIIEFQIQMLPAASSSSSSSPPLVVVEVRTHTYTLKSK
jgi:hypothetical protein